jgi:hypothetical protein
MDATITAVIDAETSKFRKALDDAKKHIKDFDKKSSDASNGVKQAFEKVKGAAKTAADTIKKHLPGAIDAAKKAAAGLTVAFGLVTKGTEQYRNEQAKLLTAFESAGSSAEAAKSTFTSLYKVLGEDDQAVEAANHIAQLTTNQKDMAEWTNICQGVYATFGASLPIEGLTEAANETAKVGQVTGVLADALNWAGVSEDAFNAKLEKCNTEAEREALIRTTLNGLYDEASKSLKQITQLLLNKEKNKLN